MRFLLSTVVLLVMWLGSMTYLSRNMEAGIVRAVLMVGLTVFVLAGGWQIAAH